MSRSKKQPSELEAGGRGGPSGGIRRVALAEDPGSETVLAAAAGLAREGVLLVDGVRDPSRWIERLAERGFRAEPDQTAEAEARLLVRSQGAAPLLDLRELEAPEPMERILEAAARLGSGEALLARTPRMPRMLFPQLERRGLAWEAVEEPDGSGLVHVRRPA